MEAWVSAIIEVLWRNGLAVVPLAVLVAGICRWVPSRPATRHTLWLLVLLWFVVPPVLPALNVDTLVDRADRLTANAPPRLAAVSPAEPASTEEHARSANDASPLLPVIRGVGWPMALAVGKANSEVEFVFPTSQEVGHPSFDVSPSASGSFLLTLSKQT